MWWREGGRMVCTLRVALLVWWEVFTCWCVVWIVVVMFSVLALITFAEIRTSSTTLIAFAIFLLTTRFLTITAFVVLLSWEFDASFLKKRRKVRQEEEWRWSYDFRLESVGISVECCNDCCIAFFLVFLCVCTAYTVTVLTIFSDCKAVAVKL